MAYLEREIRRTFALAEAQAWRSHDPFDLLLSPALAGLRNRTRLGSRVAVQIGRRTGIRTRQALRVPQHEEAKTLADFLRAAALLGRSGPSWCLPVVDGLSRRLCALGTPGSGEPRGWGFSFPYTSRFVNVPSGEPNAYITMCVIEALLDAAEYPDRDPRVLESAWRACMFLLDDLGSFTMDGFLWTRYWRGLDHPIVNIQASLASLLARAARRFGDDVLRQRGEDAMATTLGVQRADGSWLYSCDGRAEFVDGFHTGFVLQGLAELAGRAPTLGASARGSIERGMRYFREHLLTPEGLPRGFADGAVSLDGQNLAQCLQTLIIGAGRADDIAAAGRLWTEAARRGRSPLQPHKGYLALRWCAAPGVLAAAHLSAARSVALVDSL